MSRQQLLEKIRAGLILLLVMGCRPSALAPTFVPAIPTAPSTPTPVPPAATTTPTPIPPTATSTPTPAPKQVKVSNGVYELQVSEAGRLPVGGSDKVIVWINFASNDPNLAPNKFLTGGLDSCGTLKDTTGHSWGAWLAGQASGGNRPTEVACGFKVPQDASSFIWYASGYPGVALGF